MATLRDVTEQREIESIVAMQLKAMESAANGIFVTDIKNKFKWVNEAFCRMCGYEESDLLGKTVDLVNSNVHDADFFNGMRDTVSSGQVWRGQTVNRHRDGQLYTANQTVTPIRDTAGRITHFVSIQEDISERLKAQEDLAHLAEFDTLTDLPNRTLFMDRLSSAVERAARAQVRVAVMVMDLDNFKDVNNALGHDRAEALLRWHHPELGLISPGTFIPIAESSGLILPIGDWIIDRVCAQTAAWCAIGLPPLQVGINISGHQFKHRDPCAQVLGQLDHHKLNIEAVDLEITETVAMERTERVTANVEQLVAAGISISMDDFGTGYSSLSNLQAFPVRRLKVDASFVRGIGTDRDDEKIVEAVISLGHSLGLSVIAEGVETHDHVSFLKNLRCNEIQGYLVSKPLPAEDFVAFLKDHTPRLPR